jgi:hypothetical protein
VERETITIDGVEYIQIGDRLMPINDHGEIQATAEEIPNANGGVDVIVHVPFLQLSGKSQG